ncbi:MAG: hypothetical protein AAGA03_05395 [Planctomycetota bacterium]
MKSLPLPRPTCQETILSIIPGETVADRIVLATCHDGSERPIRMRRESFSEAIGWFTQSSISMTRMEMQALRSAMGAPSSSGCQHTAQRLRSARTDAPAADATILPFPGQASA